MPRKSRAPRASKKPTIAKAKRVVTKQRKAKAKRNMDTFFLQAKNVGLLTPTQGVSVANYLYWAVSLDPTAPSSGMSYLTNAEFLLYSTMYDKYRVNSVNVKIVPKANVLDQVNAQNDAAYRVTGDGMIHTCIDRDSTAPSNIAVISRYPSYRKYSVSKPFSRTYAVKYPMGIWIDCQESGSFTMAKELGLTGGITLYAENFLEDLGELYNEPWAEVHVAYNIVFQGKSSSSISVTRDASGNLTGVSLVPHQPADNLVQTIPLNIRGTEDDVRLDDQNADPPNQSKITDRGNA